MREITLEEEIQGVLYSADKLIAESKTTLQRIKEEKH